MATNTTSPTPSEDNLQNNRDDIMYSALDKVMRNTEQSYEDFLNTFTYLKKASQEKKTDSGKKKTSTVDKTTNASKGVKFQKKKEVSASGGVTLSNKPYLSQSEDIEEEVLNEGDSTSRMAKTKVIRTGSLVKFDNFVDPVADPVEDVEELTDMSDGRGYTASFSDGKSVKRDPENTTGEAGRVRDINISVQLQDRSVSANTDVSNTLDSQFSLDEKSTDKLLMNFLADLQNELNEGGSTNDRPSTETTDSPMDIQNFVDKNKKQKDKVLEEVNFDDDDNDAINLLQDDSEKNSVKVKISDEEFSQVVKSDNVLDRERKSRLEVIYRDTLMDSEGNISKVTLARSGAESEEVDKETDEDNTIVPGQVEESSHLPAMENDTLLDFKATYRETVEGANTRIDSTNDLIQPFQLDDDFDYDNVVLAPKFSSEDLQQLKTNLKPQTMVI